MVEVDQLAAKPRAPLLPLLERSQESPEFSARRDRRGKAREFRLDLGKLRLQDPRSLVSEMWCRAELVERLGQARRTWRSMALSTAASVSAIGDSRLFVQMPRLRRWYTMHA